MDSADKISKILAVDDEKFNLLLLQTCLKGEKYRLKTCSNGLEALDEFKKDSFDLVLLDIMMNGIDGFEIRKLIREINKRVPIIFLTSMVDDINSTMLSHISADQYSYYMHKSFNKTTLLAKIEDAISVYNEYRNTDSYYQRMEEDLVLAGEVQKIMLPPWCMAHRGMVLSYIYMPSMQVSGDMLEMMELDNHRTLFFIGDIAGHGIQAALYMSAILSYLKVLLYTNRTKPQMLKPHILMNQIEQFFRNELANKNYMTCILAIFDFSKNHLSFLSAGHPGMICCSPKKGTAHIVEQREDQGGLPVGLVQSNIYRVEDTVEYDFEDDDIFLAYTDGILDVMNTTGETVDDETFFSLLGSLSAESEAPAIPYRIFNALEQIGYERRPDDICLAALHKRLDSESFMQRIISATTGEVSNCVLEFEQFVQKQYAEIELSARIELLLSEFLNNIIIHGLESKTHSKMNIYVSARLTKEEIHVLVLDRGQNWNCSIQSSVKPDEILERKNADHATSGRGMAIIYRIASTISRNHFSGINETLFIVKTNMQES